MDVVLCDNKYILTHSVNCHTMLACWPASKNVVQKDA